MMEGMSTCHDVQLIENNEGVYQLQGDELDQKMFGYFDCKVLREYDNDSDFPFRINQIVQLRVEEEEICYLILKKFAFSPVLQRQSIIVGKTRNNNNYEYNIFTKGSPEMLKEICSPETIPQNYDLIIQQYASEGYRIIALATKDISLPSAQFLQKLERNEIENDLQFLGLIIFENKLKEQTKAVIQELNQKTKIKSKMVTGDNPLTAISVARQCEIIQPGQEVYLSLWEEERSSVKWQSLSSAKYIDNDNYCLAITGPIFSYLQENFQVNDFIKEHGVIYSRMNPKQKQKLVECLQQEGPNHEKQIIAMCGDGANDCEAMIQSDVSLALVAQEASLASAFTSNSINDVTAMIELIKEGRCALVTSFGAFKFMTLYSLIQFFSIIYLYYYGSDLMDYQYLYIDVWILGTLIYTMDMAKPSNYLTQLSPITRLVSFEVLSNVIGQFILMLIFQIIIMVILQQQIWFVSNLELISKENLSEFKEIQCYENSILFLFTVFQYLTIAISYYSGAPFRTPLQKNFIFIFNIGLILLLHCILLFNSGTILNDILEIKHVQFDFCFLMMCIASINAALSFFYSGVMQPYLVKRYKIWKDSSQQF